MGIMISSCSDRCGHLVNFRNGQSESSGISWYSSVSYGLGAGLSAQSYVIEVDGCKHSKHYSVKQFQPA